MVIAFSPNIWKVAKVRKVAKISSLKKDVGNFLPYTRVASELGQVAGNKLLVIWVKLLAELLEITTFFTLS